MPCAWAMMLTSFFPGVPYSKSASQDTRTEAPALISGNTIPAPDDRAHRESSAGSPPSTSEPFGDPVRSNPVHRLHRT